MIALRSRSSVAGGAALSMLFTLLGIACSSGHTNSAAGTSAGTGGDTALANAPHNVTLTGEQRQRIQTITVKPTAFRPLVEATGNVAFNGDRSTQVLSPVSGPTLRVVVTPGTVVTRGQPLAYVSSPDFASAVADYRKALTAYRNAKRIADRDSALFANDALARGDLEQAQADAAAADADVDAALQNMRALGVEESQIEAVKSGQTVSIEAIVRAPIAGTVVEKLIADGQLLQAGTTPTFTIADLSTMWVMANVFENDLRDVSVGQTVNILTDASHAPLRGRVDYVASLADPGTKAVSVRVLVPNTNQVLRRDMFVRVQIEAGHEHHGIVVPVAAILRDDQNLPYVFVVADSTGYARRRVTIGSRVGDGYEITEGLTGGEQVVANGALFVQFAETQ